jgi:hypothetical protein
MHYSVELLTLPTRMTTQERKCTGLAEARLRTVCVIAGMMCSCVTKQHDVKQVVIPALAATYREQDVVFNDPVLN